MCHTAFHVLLSCTELGESAEGGAVFDVSLLWGCGCRTVGDELATVVSSRH